MQEGENTIIGGTDLTYGQKAVGITFNPAGDPGVQKIKELYAQIIDICNEGTMSDKTVSSSERLRLFKIAITEAQTAQMWAVKAITYQY